jgi:peroxiredoxin
MVGHMHTPLAGVAAAALIAAATPNVGDVAPDFTLPSSSGKDVHLSDYKGRTVVLAFYVKAFTGG